MRLRLGTTGKRWAFVLAVVAVTLVSAQVAGAQAPLGEQPTAGEEPSSPAQAPPGGQPPAGQQPPTGSTPPPGGQPPGAQNADLSIELREAKGAGSEIHEGERVRYDTRVVNHGPGIARGVQVVVSSSEDFDLDEVNHEGECQTNPGGEGRMVCSYGDLAPGAELVLKFRGQFRDKAGRTRTHVYVAGLSPDPDPTNNHDRQGSRVNENEVEVEVEVVGACAGGTLRLIGGDGDQGTLFPDSTGEGIEVVSDLEVRLNGETIFEDDDNDFEFNALGRNPLDPIEFEANPGDRLRIIAESDRFGERFLDPLALECPDGTQQELTEGVAGAVAPPNTVFFDEEFVIGLGE